NQLKTLFTNVHNGTYDANQYYTQAVQFDCRDVSKTNFIKRLCTILDTVNNYVKKGWVEWATITEKDQYWRSASGLDSTYYFLDCDNLPASISAMKKTENKIVISPNPASDILFITSEGEKIKQFEIYDMTGKIVFAASPALQSYSLNVKDFDSGLYFLKVRSDNDTLMGTKFIVF
ncbi:MAG: T9SS type A sorting domain-containing protein, partial [Bacteroidia bacterium]|nr:T9SS type A sorting domain-containing protein [Bacteroidia bacterium]